MWQSALLLAKGIVRHWLQALGGALMAIVGLVSQIRSWIVPPGVWLALSGVLFLWAILETVHELRLRLPTETSVVGKFFHTFSSQWSISVSRRGASGKGREVVRSAI